MKPIDQTTRSIAHVPTDRRDASPGVSRPAYWSGGSFMGAARRSARDLVLELLLERVEVRHARRQARLLGKHDGDAVAHRVTQPADLGDEKVPLLPQPAARDG